MALDTERKFGIDMNDGAQLVKVHTDASLIMHSDSCDKTAEQSPSAACPCATLSVVMVVRNGAAMLERCLASCRFASEVVVVDDFSNDQTVAIARHFGAKVFQRALADDWAAQQNFAIQQAAGEWIFLIDHDEVVSEELADAICSAVQRDERRVYSLRRVTCFNHLKAAHGAFRPDWVARLFPRQGANWVGCVHQQLCSPYQPAKLPASAVLHHYTTRTLPQYWSKMDRYARLSAEKYHKNSKRISRPSLLLQVTLRPLWSFLQSYFLWKGFLDGALGWYFAWQYAGYTMNKYMQLYLLQQQDGEL